MSVKKVVNRALKDPKFAKELKKMASKAAKDGVGSEAERAFTAMLVNDPSDLVVIPGTGAGGSGSPGGTSFHKAAIAELLGAIARLQRDNA